MAFNSAIISGVPGSGVRAPTPPNLVVGSKPINLIQVTQANVGDEYLDNSTGTFYKLNFTEGVGRAWIVLGFSAGQISFIKTSDGNEAAPALGVVTLAQGNGILTTSSGSTATVAMSNNYTASSGGYNITGTNNYALNLISTVNTTAAGPYLSLYRNRTAVNGDSVGGILFSGNNSTPAVVDYASQQVTIDDVVAGSEEGTWTLYTMQEGVLTAQITASSSGITTITGSVVINGGTQHNVLNLSSTDTTTTDYVAIQMYANRASPANGDGISVIAGQGNNASSVLKAFSYILTSATTVTAGAESGTLSFQVISAGSVVTPLTLTGTSTIVSGSATINSGSVANTLTVTSIDNTALAAGNIVLYKNRSATANNDYTGQIQFTGNNSTPAQVLYGSVTGQILNKTAGSETASIILQSANAGNPYYNQLIAGPTGCQVLGYTGATPSQYFVGEVVSSYVGSSGAQSINNTSVNITSISLTAGVWQLYGCLVYTVTTVSAITIQAGYSTTSATITGNAGVNYITTLETGTGTLGAQTLTLMPLVVVLSTTTTYYFVASGSTAGTSATAYGNIAALRVA